MITNEDLSNVPTYTRFADFNYKIKATSSINEILIDNTFLEQDRFKIYGAAVNLSKSNINYIKDASFDTIKVFYNSGYLKIEPFPVPMLTNINEWNICSSNTIAHVNDHFGLDAISDAITD